MADPAVTLGASDRAGLRQVGELVASRRREEALARMRTLTEPETVHPLVLYTAASLALSLESLTDAREWSLRLSRMVPPDWPSALKVIDLLRGAGLAQSARDYLKRSRQRYPDQPALESRAGQLAAGRGDLAEARRHYRRALALDATLTAPYLFLSRDADTEVDPLLASIDAALRQSDIAPVQRANLLLARGHCLDRLQDYPAAFQCFDQARGLTHDSGRAAALERQVASAPGLVADFSAPRMARLRSQGHDSDRPVFVVGLPRSGSTLIAQVLGAHPAVVSLGERRFLGNIVHDRFAAASGEDSLLDALAGHGGMAELGRQYLDRASVLADPGARRWVDKLPFNFSLTGAAHLIFPAARTIYTRRRPLDTCWSLFTAGFALKALQLSLVEIGRLHALSEYLMAHWRRVLPDCVQVVDYESLVDDLAREGGRLVAALGLDWDEACLDFHRQGNDVMTASDTQVRQPLYTTSVGRSDPYARWLGDFEQSRADTLTRLGMSGQDKISGETS